MLTTSTMIRHMLLESDNVPTYKLLNSGLTSDIYWTRFGSNIKLFLNLLVELPVARLLPIDMQEPVYTLQVSHRAKVLDLPRGGYPHIPYISCEQHLVGRTATTFSVL